ncbi:hypothetical protein [uncultured Desulfuromonas sp.]|uniref:hypothetical protein n=1 Tax=uncultured Desulfuromonas sp. TaxID=181013 RepID=UPI002AAA7D65|nr:hypothetical protein [uncultured Desulfuromonas sp.]
MHRTLKNHTAITLLVKKLADGRPLDPADIRFQCKSVIYTCFEMGIEPFQLPIADHYAGSLSGAQKRLFWQRYLAMQLDGTTRREIVPHVDDAPNWSMLLRLVDDIVARQNV